MSLVVLEVVGVNKDVIDISSTEDIKEKVKDFVDSSLEGSRYVRKTKKYNKGLK